MKLYGLIGYPLSHSFSKKYFTEKFQQEKITDCQYENFPLEHIDQLPGLISAHPNLCGLNVTIPYKQDVIRFLDDVSISAKAIGAVNCIRITAHDKKGFNTDTIGFETSLLPLLPSYQMQALILGTGGSSKAIAYTLQRLGIAFHYVSRQKKEGQFTYEELDQKVMEEHLLIVNTTPVGMFPDTDRAPDIPYQYLSSRHLLYDLTYNPVTTLFLKKGAAQGATVKNGHEMLILQAEASWQIWNEEEA